MIFASCLLTHDFCLVLDDSRRVLHDAFSAECLVLPDSWFMR